MNKKEFIEKLKGHGAWCTECHDINGEKDRYVKVAKVRELLEQLDEPQKVKMPQFVAEWIEYNRSINGSAYSLMVGYLFNVSYCEIGEWLGPEDDELKIKRQDDLARAWLDGYEVEEEPKWVVKSNRLYFTGITQLIARDPITYNFTTDENLAHVFDDKESAEKEASFFDGAVEQVEV